MSYTGAKTGTGNDVLDTSPTITSPALVTPALGTPASGVLTNCTGTAASLTAGTASTVSSANEGTDTTCFPLFITASGNQTLQPKNHTGLTFNAQTGTLGANTFSGAGTSLTGTAASLTAGSVSSTNEATDTTCFPLFITASGTQGLQPKNNTALVFNSNTGEFGATSFTGAGTGLTGTAASLTAGAVTTNANLTGVITSSGNATSFGAFTSAQILAGCSNETGSGSLTFATSPALVTPDIGTPSSGTLTSCTGLPVSTGISGLGTGIATFLATPSSANLITPVSDETGSGALTFATSPTLVTPLLGTPTSGTLGNCVGAAITAFCTSTKSYTSSTVQAIPTGMSIALQGSTTYVLTGKIFGASAAVGGINPQLTATNSLTITSMNINCTNIGGTAVPVVLSTSALATDLCNTANQYSYLDIVGRIIVNVAGTINFSAAQHTSNGTATTVLSGSYIEVVKT